MTSTNKAASLKRAQDDEDNGRPFKKQIVEVTGLEEDITATETTPRAISTISTSEIGLYNRRRKVALHANQIRKKKAMVQKVNGDWSGMSASAQGGLDNFTGAICYRLSLLQALLHQPKFVRLLQDFHRPDDCVSDDRDHCITCCLRLLAQEYWRGSQSGTSKVLRVMNGLFKSAGWASDVSSGHADPDEHASWLFGAIQRELPSSISLCLEALLQPIFTAAVCCAKCGYQSKTSGHQDRALPLPLLPAIKPVGTLAAYLQKYMVEEVVDYKCDKCHDKTSKKHRKQLINYAPDIFSFQLKRTDPFGRKLHTAVTITPTIDLSIYRATDNDEPLRYEITAIIKHRGDLNSGHYTCSTKGPDGQWYGFDDSKKSVISFATAASSSQGFTPYLLFFQRKRD